MYGLPLTFISNIKATFYSLFYFHLFALDVPKLNVGPLLAASILTSFLLLLHTSVVFLFCFILPNMFSSSAS